MYINEAGIRKHCWQANSIMMYKKSIVTLKMLCCYDYYTEFGFKKTYKYLLFPLSLGGEKQLWIKRAYRDKIRTYINMLKMYLVLPLNKKYLKYYIKMLRKSQIHNLWNLLNTFKNNELIKILLLKEELFQMQSS